MVYSLLSYLTLFRFLRTPLERYFIINAEKVVPVGIICVVFRVSCRHRIVICLSKGKEAFVTLIFSSDG